MRLLSRVLFTFALLGGLAFGSYAFGKHVLSSKLFGNKGSNLNQNFGESAIPLPATHGTSHQGNTAIASVEVMPESGDSGAPSKPDAAPLDPATPDATAATDRSSNGLDGGTARPGSRDIIGDPNAVIGRDRSNASDPSNPDHPRRRRRHRKPRTVTTPESGAATETPARQDYSASPDATVSQETSPRDTSNDTSSAPAPRIDRSEPRRETPSDNSNSDAPAEGTPRRRRHTRTRVEEPTAPRTRIEPRRETPPTRRQDESPVPRPEGGDSGGGGESPVPVPE